MSKSIVYNGSVFSFERNEDGEGNWFCKSGKFRGAVAINGTCRNQIVHANLSAVLTELAIESGVGKASDFHKNLAKPKYASVSSGGREPSAKRLLAESFRAGFLSRK